MTSTAEVGDQVVALARGMRDLVRAEAAESERMRTLTGAIVDEMWASGLMSAFNPVAAGGVEPDVRDRRAIEPKLGIEGDSHRSAPRRFPGLGCGNGGFLRETLEEVYGLRGAFPPKSREKRDSSTFSDGHSLVR